jgi:hypothetical protein
MLKQFRSYFTKLESLSITELDRSAEKLVFAENQNVAKLIAHIAEMSARKAALELGYKNLFDYCVRRLNLSEGAVPARIHVANVSRRFPQLLVALAENRISLTALPRRSLGEGGSRAFLQLTFAITTSKS